jgi:hypothetical protein
MENLGFDSPGPAFSMLLDVSDTATESEAEGGRTRRRARSSLIAARPSSSAEQETDSSAEATTKKMVNGHANGIASSSASLDTDSQPAAPPTKSIFRNWSPIKAPKGSPQYSAVKMRKSRSSSLRNDDDAVIPLIHRQQPLVQASTTSSNGKRRKPTEMNRQESLLGRRRGRLDDVYKEHDVLVRELFHLRKFVTYFGYDPEVSVVCVLVRGAQQTLLCADPTKLWRY